MENRNILKAGLLFSLVIFLSGCVGSSKVVLKPSDLREKGLLVARMEGNNINFNHSTYSGDVYISGKKYKDSINKNYITIPLTPGKYNLEKIGTFTGMGGMPGTSTHRTYSRFPVKRNFTIKAGSVTNLGYIYAHFPDVKKQRYRTFALDNNKEIAAYLKKEQPGFYKSLNKNSIKLAKDKYLSSVELNKLRKMIALQQANIKAYAKKNIIPGRLGLVAQIKRNSKNQVAQIELINTGTTDTVSYCSDNKFQYACIIPNGNESKLLTGDYRKKTIFKRLPNGLKNPDVYVLGKQYILLVDGAFNIYESYNRGKSFSVNSLFKFPGANKDGLGFSLFYKTKKGLYIVAQKGNGRIIFRASDSKTGFKSLPIPKDVSGKRLSHLYETKKGILMGPYPGVFSSSEIYYLINGSKKWVEVTIPSASCYDIKVTNYNMAKLHLRCGMRGPVTNYKSHDSGATWVKL